MQNSLELSERIMLDLNTLMGQLHALAIVQPENDTIQAAISTVGQTVNHVFALEDHIREVERRIAQVQALQEQMREMLTRN